MTTNERQYRITRAEMARFEEALAKSEAQGAHRHPRLRQATQEALESHLQELREQVAEYEGLRHTMVYTWCVVAFEWDEGNEDHIAEHGVTPEDVEEGFFDRSRMAIAVYRTVTERRRGLVGRTEDGRLLFVVYTRREGAIRVVTARDASERHRRGYERNARP